MTLYGKPLIYALGDSAITVEFAETISNEANELVHALADELERDPCQWLLECVPTYRSLTVYYLSGVFSYSVVCDHIEQMLPRLRDHRKARDGGDARMVRIPVAYGGDCGPDLQEVAARNQLTEDEVIRLHTAQPYRVYMLGFSPGFPFLGPIPASMATPRRSEPRRRVSPGSVGIAGLQTGVYPLETPGGWQLIGKTKRRLFEPSRSDPFLIHPGDRVQFIRSQEDAEGMDPDSCEQGWNAEEMEAAFESSGKQESETGCVDVLEGGLLTTIQDRGRQGYQRYGLSVGGAMDPIAMQVANWLVDNAGDEACIETGLRGPILQFSAPTRIAICGTDMMPCIDDRMVPMWRCLEVTAGAKLRLGGAVQGNFCYIAIAGGVDVPAILGSRSTDLTACIGGLRGERVKSSDRIPYRLKKLQSQSAISRFIMTEPVSSSGNRFCVNEMFVRPEAISSYMGSEALPIRVLPGPQYNTFSKMSTDAMIESAFIVRTDSDRRAIRLGGSTLPLQQSTDIVSDALSIGSIQVLPSGELVVLMADRQTIGGYAKIAVVISADLPRLAQLRPGGTVHFQFVTIDEAELAAKVMLRELTMIKAALTQRPPR